MSTIQGTEIKLSCVIPATDSPPTLARCLAAITASDRAPDQLLAVREADQTGAAAARNAGIEHSAGDVVAFVDADVEVHADAFARIRAAFGADPQLAAIFGAYDDAPEASDPISGFRNMLHHCVHVEGAGLAGTFWTGLGAIRREVLDEVGGFDPRRECIEDIDLGVRITAAGHRVRLDPRIRGKHLKRWGLLSMIRTDFAGRGIPWTRLVLETGQARSALNLGWRGRSGVALSATATAALALRRPRGALAAVGALGLTNLPLIRLLAAHRGGAQAALAIPLLLVHHLTGLAAAAAGSLAHVGAILRSR